LITDWLSQTVYSSEELRQPVTTKEALSLKMSSLVKEKADIAAAITTAKKKLREALKNTINMEEKHGTVLEKTV
jgi:hypothetical protein